MPPEAQDLTVGMKYMHAKRIEELPHEVARAVIINVGTDLVATLALASARAHCSMPILLINCDPTPESRSHFGKLMASFAFDTWEAPRRSHGRTLDDLFSRIKADLVLLLDSDAEIRDHALISGMRDQFANPHVFGAGFTNGPGWLYEPPRYYRETTFFQERSWMPCVMFRGSHIRQALAAGVSFEARVIYNDFMFSRAISRQLAKRFQTELVPPSQIVRHLPKKVQFRLRQSRLPWLRWARQDFYGHRPNYVYCDTGADVYQWCRYIERKIFAGTSVGLMKDKVVHYSGVSRQSLDPRQHGTRLADIESQVRCRLRDVYHLDAVGV